MEEYIMNGIKGRMLPEGGNMPFEQAVKETAEWNQRTVKLLNNTKGEAVFEVVKTGKRFNIRLLLIIGNYYN
jgi:hypothetical protein